MRGGVRAATQSFELSVRLNGGKRQNKVRVLCVLLGMCTIYYVYNAYYVYYVYCVYQVYYCTICTCTIWAMHHAQSSEAC